MSQELVVIAVDDSMKAQEMLMAAGRLAKDGKLGIDDAVVISKSDDGKTHKIETTDLTPMEGGLGGAFWGLFLGTLLTGPIGGIVTGAVTGGAGVLMAKIIDRGMSDEFIKEMEGLLEPGHAALCLLTSYEDNQAVLGELNRFDGTLIWSEPPAPGRRGRRSGPPPRRHRPRHPRHRHASRPSPPPTSPARAPPPTADGPPTTAPRTPATPSPATNRPDPSPPARERRREHPGVPARSSPAPDVPMGPHEPR